jgi:hypothetical protein
MKRRRCSRHVYEIVQSLPFLGSDFQLKEGAIAMTYQGKSARPMASEKRRFAFQVRDLNQWLISQKFGAIKSNQAA